MKQVFQNLHSGETQVLEVPVPAPQKGEVLVRTAASLVSAGTERMVVEFAEKSYLGKARSRPDLVRQIVDKARREGMLTTLEAAFNRLDQPMPLGYSSAGTVIALGEGVQSVRIGQRVACAGGGFAVHAEYAAVPCNLIAPIPDQIDFEAAAFTTLGAIALHGFRLSKAQLGDQLAVIGLGLIGLLAVGIAKAGGCRVLGIDLDPQRVALARELGAEAVLRPQAEEAAMAFASGRGCDEILICADSASDDPVELAGVIARDRANVIAIGAVGLHLPRKIYYEKELTFLNARSYGPGRYDPAYEEGGRDYPIGYVRWTEGRNLEAFVALLASQNLDIEPLISHRFPIEQASQAYDLITGKNKQPYLGVLLTYPPAASQPESIGVSQIDRIAISSHPNPSPADRVNAGILGAGNFAGAVLLPAMQKIEQVELIGIASASGASAQIAARRFGIRYATSDDAQILNDPQINTIAILTRHHLHARQVVRALSAGKHVFCEKPLALNEGELNEIAEALQDNHSKELQDGQSPSGSPLLMVGFNRRFAPFGRKLLEFLDRRKEPLMAHYRVNAGYLPLTHWLHDPEQGGGRIIGEGCHFIDFLTFLVGAPPIKVSACGLPDSGRYREDNLVITCTFKDQSVGTVSYLANGDKGFAKERVEVFCAGKVAVLDDFRTLELTMGGKRQVFHSRLRQDKGHRAEWEAFSAAIISGEPAPIPCEQLFGVTRATFAAVQALRTGEIVALESFD